jgi:hypothetical protein
MRYITGSIILMLVFGCGTENDKKVKDKVIEEIVVDGPEDKPEAVQEVVIAKFEEMFGSDIEVEWEFEHGKWEAEFDDRGKEVEVYFTTVGLWFVSCNVMVEYPEGFFKDFLDDFEGYELVEVFETKTTTLEGYRIELLNNEEEVDILFTNDLEIVEIEKERVVHEEDEIE